MAQRFWPRRSPVSTSMSSRSALEKRCFSSASQTGQPAFGRSVPAIPGATMIASSGPSLAILGEPFGPRKAMLFVCFADRASPLPLTAALPLCIIQRDDVFNLTFRSVSMKPGLRREPPRRFAPLPLYRGRVRRAGTPLPTPLLFKEQPRRGGVVAGRPLRRRKLQSREAEPASAVRQVNYIIP